MGFFLVFVSVAVYVLSALVFSMSSSAIQECVGGIGGIVATIFFVGGFAVDELVKIRKGLAK